MGNYISQEIALTELSELIKRSENVAEYKLGVEAAYEIIKRIPAADVSEVVSCVNCIHFHESLDRTVCYCTNPYALNEPARESYCSKGHRRRDNA